QIGIQLQLADTRRKKKEGVPLRHEGEREGEKQLDTGHKIELLSTLLAKEIYPNIKGDLGH
ncbi:hypothetical protein ACJX0J_027366, partial [Zea mays]